MQRQSLHVFLESFPQISVFSCLLGTGPRTKGHLKHYSGRECQQTGRQSINGPGPRASPQPITDPCLLREAQALLQERVPHCQTETEPTVVLLAFPTALPCPGRTSPQGDSVNQKGSNTATNPACSVQRCVQGALEGCRAPPRILPTQPRGTAQHCCRLLLLAEGDQGHSEDEGFTLRAAPPPAPPPSSRRNGGLQHFRSIVGACDHRQVLEAEPHTQKREEKTPTVQAERW